MTGSATLAELSGGDAVQEAVRRVAAGEASRSEVLLQLSVDQLADVVHARFDRPPGAPIAAGLGASPGAATGRVRFSAAGAADAADRGEAVILVRAETTPDDLRGMRAADGILTTRGGLASHAAVVARGWGIPAVVGVDAAVTGAASLVIGDVEVAEGDLISIDGATGQVWLGERSVAVADPGPAFEEVLAWADEVRGDRIAVRANADTPADIVVARAYGAQGVGLCRTEHMFLAEDRLPVLRRVLLAATPEEEVDALEELRAVQRRDFTELLRCLDGQPITVRLLDAPLHEFLPTVPEHNPMLGTRGVRLAVIRPGLYGMQVRALLDAVASVPGARVEVMVPLTVNPAELALVRLWVDDAVAEAALAGRRIEVAVGTMVETPSAALRAGALAEVAEFLSFGTNDLTQLTLGFSRDDVEARLLPEYLRAGLLPANPFETLDADGVGELLAIAVTRARAARPDVVIGVCGEHGGEPRSIERFVALGLDYVSCSPFRVPMARLAVAQAMLGQTPPT